MSFTAGKKITIPSVNMGTSSSASYYLTNIKPNAVIVGGAAYGIGGYASYINASGNMIFAPPNTYAQSSALSSNLPWNHITITRNNLTVKFFNNAVQLSNITNLSSNTSGPMPTTIGSYSGGSFQYIGSLDELRLSSVDRSADWIAAEYANQNSPSTFYAIGSQQVGNSSLTATDDTTSTNEDVLKVVNVLANDTDPDGDTLSVSSATDPAHGSTTVNGDNTITYTPDANWNGIDTFDYTISDGNGGTDTATVTITVNAVNDAPVANFSFDASADPLIDFSDSSSDTDGTISSWSWDFGDSASSTSQSPSHTYTVNDSYSVTLTVTDNSGATDQIVKSVSVGAADTISPIISNINSSSNGAGTSLTITWQTDENASSQVNYGLTASLGASTPETDTSPRTTNHSVTITNLIPCSFYHLSVVSVDGSANSVTSTSKAFHTSGCVGSAAITSHSEELISRLTGGNLASGVARLDIPSGFWTQDVVFQVKQVGTADTINTTRVPTGQSLAGGAYDIKALTSTATVVHNFSQPITITLGYTASDAVNIYEDTLKIYHWDDDTGWQSLSNCSVDKAARKVSCKSSDFSIFAVFGSPKLAIAPQQTTEVSAELSAKDSITDQVNNQTKAEGLHRGQSKPSESNKIVDSSGRSGLLVVNWWWSIVIGLGVIGYVIAAKRKKDK